MTNQHQSSSKLQPPVTPGQASPLNTGFFTAIGRRLDSVLGTAVGIVQSLRDQYLRRETEPTPAVIEYQDGLRSAAFLYDRRGQTLNFANEAWHLGSSFEVAHSQYKSRACNRLLITAKGNDYSLRFYNSGEQAFRWMVKDLKETLSASFDIPHGELLSITVGQPLSLGSLQLGTVEKMVAIDSCFREDPNYASHWQKIAVPFPALRSES